MKRKSLAISIISAVAAAAAGWLFLAAVDANARKWETKITAKETRVARLSGLSSRRTAIEAESRRFESYWKQNGRSQEAEWADLAQEIETAARKAAAGLSEIRRSDIVPNEGWKEYRMDFEVAGGMGALTRFFESLEVSQSLTRIAQAKIVIAPDKKGLFKATVSVTRAVIA
jgi:multidrug efflux pump subunit AcrA (membrane-fusion protein)